MWEHRRNLKRADDAPPCNLSRRLRRDVGSIEKNHAAGGLDELGEQIKAGRFAGAVGADQCVNRAPAHLQVHLVNGHKALEFFGELLCLEDDVCRHGPRC